MISLYDNNHLHSQVTQIEKSNLNVFEYLLYCSTKRTKRTIQSVFSFVCNVGRHLWCCGQNCPLEPRDRAGAHSPVQARSFHYYSARTRLQLPASPPKSKKHEPLWLVFCFFIEPNYVAGELNRSIKKMVDTHHF